MCQVDDEDEDDDDPNKTYDLIILGLPWKTSEDDIREYFEVSGLNIISFEDMIHGNFYDVSSTAIWRDPHDPAEEASWQWRV